MFAGLVAATVLSLGSFAAAENSSTPYKYAVPASSINSTLLAGYCQSQNNVCNQLCYKGVAPGSPFCNSTTLAWTCTCANGPTPDLTQYNGTIPFFECLTYIAQCQQNNTQSPTKQHQCLQIQCGGKNASAYMQGKTGTGTTTNMHTSTPKPKPGGGSGGGKPGSGGGGSGPKGSGSGSGGNGGGSGGGSPNAASALEFGKSYGLATMVVAGMLTFGVALGI